MSEESNMVIVKCDDMYQVDNLIRRIKNNIIPQYKSFHYEKPGMNPCAEWFSNPQKEIYYANIKDYSLEDVVKLYNFQKYEYDFGKPIYFVNKISPIPPPTTDTQLLIQTLFFGVRYNLDDGPIKTFE